MNVLDDIIDGIDGFDDINISEDVLDISGFEDSTISDGMLVQVSYGDTIETFLQRFGGDLTFDDVMESIQCASDFFNIHTPQDIHEDWTTGVLTQSPFTENDDILIFNRQQLANLGITDRNSFDLVMTHEGAHRALQGLREETGFNSHQEELCCDYLAGVRAGLNNMDVDKMVSSLEGTFESVTHPDGAFRVEAIGRGVDFANHYMEEHGQPPTLSECLDDFSHSQLCHNQVNLRPEESLKAYTQGDIEWLEHQVRITSGSEQAHWYEELKWAKSHISGYVITENYDNPSISFGAYYEDKAYYENLADKASKEAEYYANEARKAAERGDYAKSQELAHTSEKYAHEAKDYLKCASECKQ